MQRAPGTYICQFCSRTEAQRKAWNVSSFLIHRTPGTFLLLGLPSYLRSQEWVGSLFFIEPNNPNEKASGKKGWGSLLEKLNPAGLTRLHGVTEKRVCNIVTRLPIWGSSK